MFCPRCGTVAAAPADACTRCGSSLARPVEHREEPPVPRAPTQRGAQAQREAGIVPTVLAKPRPPRPPAPQPPSYQEPGRAAPSPGVPLAEPGYQPPPAPPAHQPPPGYQPAPSYRPPAPPAHQPPPAQPAYEGPPAPASPAPARENPPAWPPPPPENPPGWPPPPAWPASPPAAQPASDAWMPPRAPHAPVAGGRESWPPPSSRWAPRKPGGPTQPAWLTRLVGSPEAVAAAHAGTTPPTYFWQALVCVFLFPPAGLVAAVNSVLVTQRAQSGDAGGAARASYLARVWCLIALVGFIVAALVVTITGIKA